MKRWNWTLKHISKTERIERKVKAEYLVKTTAKTVTSITAEYKICRLLSVLSWGQFRPSCCSPSRPSFVPHLFCQIRRCRRCMTKIQLQALYKRAGEHVSSSSSSSSCCLSVGCRGTRHRKSRLLDRVGPIALSAEMFGLISCLILGCLILGSLLRY